MLRQQEDTIQLDNKLLDGEVDMMALHNHYFQKSRRPLHHPNEHKTHELKLIRKIYKRYSRDGLAEIYVQCQRRGYNRSYGAMKKMIKKLQLTEKKELILKVNGLQYQLLIQEKKYKSTLNMFHSTV